MSLSARICAIVNYIYRKHRVLQLLYRYSFRNDKKVVVSQWKPLGNNVPRDTKYACAYECAHTRETEHNASLNLDQQRTQQQATKSDWALTTFLSVRKCVQCRLKIQLSVELTWTLLRGKRESIGPCVAAFRSTRVWATLILPCNRSKNCIARIDFYDDKSLFARYCSYLQQNQHFVHELQTLLRIAEYEDSEAIFRAIGAEEKRYISNIKLWRKTYDSG